MKTRNAKQTRAGGPRPPKTASRRGAASHVVGIGGSAGSLEPLERFFRALRPKSAMSFIVVTHRDPRSKGMMAEILARFTSMRVCEASQGARLERGVVYVVPSDRHLDLRDGRVELLERPTDARARTPIDSLFRAIAGDRHERAVGIVLSGMGTDGTIGLGAIKENLGVALVQDPSSASYDAMPRSAITGGLADFVGTPEMLAETLDALDARVVGLPEPEPAPSARPLSSARSTDEVLALVRRRTGHDFSQYKKSTIARRVERRMILHRVGTIPEYLHLLERDANEIDRLFADLLIGVTRFFRDPEVFEELKTRVLPELFRSRPAERPLRVWVAGCASGEEAYSMAIIIREYWDQQKRKEPLNVQLYATDLDRAAIDRARKGSYGLDIAVDVSRERLKRFFAEENGCYRVKTDIRDMVVFATQNLISDPPFTKLDILSCRNVLIYLDPELQRKIVPVFLYALAPGGVLVLGASEAVNGFEDGFAPVSEHKIFKRHTSTRGLEQALDFPIATPRGKDGRSRAAGRAAVAAAPMRARLPDVVQRQVVEHVAPPVIVVDESGTLLFASQRTGRYLEPAAGTANLNVFAMAREGLSLPLRTAVRKALARRAKVTQRGVRVLTNGHTAVVDVSALPIPDAEYAGAVLVAFAEQPVPPVAKKGAKNAKTKGGAKRPTAAADRAALGELRETKAQLDVLMDEMGHSQQALKSANEELQSANEELQSTNEELTTSKEEMQSMNEELLTLNAELQTTNEQCATTNDDMRNLLNSSQIPTLFLDNELRLKRYTAQALRIARLIASDVGRPITDLTWNLHYDTLASDVRQVLDTLVFREAEVTALDGSVYAMRIHPYRTIDDVIDGVVVTFVDMTAQRLRLTAVAEAERQALLEDLVGRWPGVAYVEEVYSGRTVAISGLAVKRLGYARAVLRNATEEFWAAVRVKERARRRGADDEAARALAAELQEVTLRRSDGAHERYTETTTVLARGVDGRATHVLHSFRRRLDTAKGTNGGGKRKAVKRAEDSAG